MANQIILNSYYKEKRLGDCTREELLELIQDLDNRRQKMREALQHALDNDCKREV